MDQSVDQTQYWVALNRVLRLGTVRFGRLEAYFGQLENAWNADLGQLKSAGIEGRAAREIISARSRVSPDGEMERLRQAGVMAINWHHPDYPARLKEMSNPPPVLYYKGTLLASDERSVAVVGTRSPTTYGREATATLTVDLARCGITIVSGMALGIDGIPHHSALDLGYPYHCAAGGRAGYHIPQGTHQIVSADSGERRLHQRNSPGGTPG